MKKFWYWIIPPVGFWRTPRRGTVLDLLSDVPYFLGYKLVPPMSVVNDILAKGIEDAGMSGGCKWKPFQLTSEQYAELVAEMKKHGFVELTPPEWVRTASDYSDWSGEVVLGIPAEKARPLLAEAHRLLASSEPGSTERANEVYQEYFKLCSEYRTEPKIPRWERR